MGKGLAVRGDADVEGMIEAILPDGLALMAFGGGSGPSHGHLVLGVRGRQRLLSSSLAPTAKGRLDLLLQPRNAADLCHHGTKKRKKRKEKRGHGVTFSRFPVLSGEEKECPKGIR